MPSKKKKYNARFPAGRIKKIMQSDEEVGKVAQAVPIIISRTLELFVESMLTKTLRITNARNAKTLSPSHMKQCIMSESSFDFLRDLVKNIPDINVNEEQLAADNYPDIGGESSDTSSPSLVNVDISIPSSSGSTTIPLQSSSTSTGLSSGQNGSHMPYGRGRNGTGTKRAHTSASDTSQRNDWRTTKQHSLDTLTSNATRNQNFYTERIGSEHEESEAVAVTLDLSLPRDRGSDNCRPAKLTRIDSAPACIPSNSLKTNINLTPTVSGSTEQPIINFDFTKGAFLPFATVAVTTTAAQSPAEILPLTIGGINVSLSLPVTSALGDSANQSPIAAHQQPARHSARTGSSLSTKSSLPSSSSTSHSEQALPSTRDVTKPLRPLRPLAPSSISSKQLPSSRTRASQNAAANNNDSTAHSAYESSRLKSTHSSISATSGNATSSVATSPLLSSAAPTLSSHQQQPVPVNNHHVNSLMAAPPPFQQPFTNIDLSNHFNSGAAPAIPYSMPSANAVNAPKSAGLDMDEDYDDI